MTNEHWYGRCLDRLYERPGGPTDKRLRKERLLKALHRARQDLEPFVAGVKEDWPEAVDVISTLEFWIDEYQKKLDEVPPITEPEYEPDDDEWTDNYAPYGGWGNGSD